MTIERLGDNSIFNRGYKMYRIGDIVNGISRHEKIYKTKYKNTIAGIYIEKTKNLPENQKKYNYDILNQIINMKKKILFYHQRVI